VTAASPPRPARRWHLLAIAALGVGLALAPVAFQMFTRAPGGGEMIVDFEPYMTPARLAAFADELDEIDAAQREAADALDGLPADQLARYPSAVTFVEQWPAIDSDMRSMLATMEANVGNYRGVAALPPFALFPWFFVLPGLLLFGVAGWTLWADRGRAPARLRHRALVVLGVGLLAAPAMFGMFTRAPGGATMIDGFRPFMTEAKVTEIQGYFLTIGAGEGQLRRSVVPDLSAAGQLPPEQVLPAAQQLSEDWPAISGDLAPMVGTMADNVTRFQGIAALPPFGLFPWFFVIPGLAVVWLAWRCRSTIVAPVPIAPRSAGTARHPISRRRVLRVAATSAVVAELLVLGALNLLSDPATEQTTTTTRRPGPMAAAPVATTPEVAVAPFAPPPASVVPAPAPPAPAPAVAVAASPTALPRSVPAPGAPPAQALSCPLPIPPAPPGGGVASLTPLLPLFGPFSPEAFAMMPAFEPVLPLFGPMLMAGQALLEQADPVVALLLEILPPLEEAGYQVLASGYAPFRQAILDGEASVAEALAPLSEALAGTPGAGCLPALEALLTAPIAP
jgi:hypothetical protein